MGTNKNEQDFVFWYFQPDKLDTREALRNVKGRVSGENRKELHRLRWIAVAASLLILVAVGAYTLLMPKTIVLKTQGQEMAYGLPDGSRVTLAPYSSLSYPEDNCREVEMKGCVYYQVKHDEHHAFLVNGHRGHVQVLGTQFLVDERTEAPVVMVTSGKVFFSAHYSKEGVFLTKGKKAQLQGGADKPQLVGGYNVNDVAWATHRLHFENTPVTDVLKELAKLSGNHYTASDASKRLTGDFETDSLPQVVQLIEETLGIRIDSSR